MRLLVGTAIAVALAGCTPSYQGSITVEFDKPMVPEDAVQAFLHCHIHDQPWEASLTAWQVTPDLSQAQLACLRRQPHVKYVHLAE
ncbi:MAG: hypothetical protein JO079_04230 [Frankiaceae bacterium]|nr:hypothetical protein [Frankiaceae bacterium]MBV9368374.1 hypothetical protein [Frankiales bacterium]